MKKIKSAVGLVLLTAVFLLLAAAGPAADEAGNFMEQRRKFREEIKNKIERKLDSEGHLLSVIFKGEEGKYHFQISPRDRSRLKAYASRYFGLEDEKLLERVADELDTGHYIVFKEYHEDGVNLKVLFLSPKARYWEWLTDANGIEKMFHVYNFSVGLYAPDPDSMFAILQTEGTFFGFRRAVSLPLYFHRDPKSRTFSFHMPSQAEILRAVKKMPALKPGRTRPEEKFIDACRTHPYFQQVNEKGEFVVSDEEILKLYRETVAEMEQECMVKESAGHWRVQDDYPYLVVDYSLKTRVNINALIPPSLRFLAGTVEEIAQMISDEVSVKYLPLSMKNFRDFTQEWTKTGGPS